MAYLSNDSLSNYFFYRLLDFRKVYSALEINDDYNYLLFFLSYYLYNIFYNSLRSRFNSYTFYYNSFILSAYYLRVISDDSSYDNIFPYSILCF